MRIGWLAAVIMVGLLVLAGACTSNNSGGNAVQETVAATESTESAAPQEMAAAEEKTEIAAVEATPEPVAVAAPAADGNTLVMQLSSGTVTIALRPDLAPSHAERLKTLTRQGFYDGVVFHRVIPGFMAQTGDPTGTGEGGSELPDLNAEFSEEPFARGVIGMARTADPNSANSQFFITYADAAWLNGQYTVVGEVTEGMEAVDAIKKGSESNNGLVENPDKIISMKVAAN